MRIFFTEKKVKDTIKNMIEPFFLQLKVGTLVLKAPKAIELR
jgi:hypothetical protein